VHVVFICLLFVTKYEKHSIPIVLLTTIDVTLPMGAYHKSDFEIIKLGSRSLAGAGQWLAVFVLLMFYWLSLNVLL
jgi:hypothetical protein